MLTSCSGVSHAVTSRVALQKVEAASTFSATSNAIFRCDTSCKHGVSHEEIFLATSNATPLRCKLQRKFPCVTWPLDVIYYQYTEIHNSIRLGRIETIFSIWNW